METQHIINVRNVVKRFKDLTAVNGVSLDIETGSFIGLLGPNGAGKTTLIEMIEGIQSPDEGEILITGIPFKSDETRLRTLMGIALQETRFIDKITVEETMDLFASFYGLPRGPGREILSMTGLSEKKDSYVMNLSGGQKQKLALGIALLNSPRVLLLDEPTTGLDPYARREIWAMLEGLRAGGTTMILTTHYMEEAEELCERIVIMHRGSFIADGSLDELQSLAGNSDIIEFSIDGLCDPSFFDSVPGLRDISLDCATGNGMIKVADSAEALPEFTRAVRESGAGLKRFESRRVSLEDLFISMTGERLNE